MEERNERGTVMATGATGQQGGAVARHLLETGFGVRVQVDMGLQRGSTGALVDSAPVLGGVRVQPPRLEVPSKLVPANRQTAGAAVVVGYDGGRTPPFQAGCERRDTLREASGGWEGFRGWKP
jgi:uncharacterized protein YbjT (DUF2867 family)